MKEIVEGSDHFKGESCCQQKATIDSKDPIYFTDIFTPEFMRLYTQYDSIEKLLSYGGFEVNSEEDYEAIPDEAIDALVLKTTNFHSWKEMLTEAVEAYTRNQCLH